jgi:hypothetical protein
MSTPAWESCSHCEVGYVKWNLSFGCPVDVVAVVFRIAKYAAVVA